MKMVSVANAKGGVGKTTTAVNLAAGLALLGKKVLMIDLDYQAHMTWAFSKEEVHPNLADVLLDNTNINEAIINISENLDLLPSHLDVTGVDVTLSAQPGRDTALAVALEDIESDRYDFIIADLPPNAGVLVLNGLAASDYVVIPIQMEYYAMKGVNIIYDLITKAKARLNKRLVIFGTLATMFDGRKIICNSTLADMKDFFGPAAFETVIRSNVSLAEAPEQNKSIFEYAPKSMGAEDYMALSKEFLKREEAFSNG